MAKCTSVINETMMNNVDNKDNDNTITYIFIGLFVVILCFCVFAYFKVKNYLKNYLKKIY